jgi:hypothetical protein
VEFFDALITDSKRLMADAAGLLNKFEEDRALSPFSARQLRATRLPFYGDTEESGAFQYVDSAVGQRN